MRAFVLLFVGLSISISVLADEPVFPATCQENCLTPFGLKLGATNDGTISYSNCQARCVYEKPNLVQDNFAGIEWQCVEFARRWLIVNKNLTFESIDVAADLWNKIDHLVNLKTKQNVPMSNHINGSNALPKKGDLLIYGREYLGTGHVAIVMGVDRKKNRVFVGEQNFLNKKWPGKYARAISYIRRGDDFWLLDSYLIGWKSY